jgi:tRNA(adenine34) deaminase
MRMNIAAEEKFSRGAEKISRDEFFMREAFREAEAAYESGEIPVGAVVVVDGKIAGRGGNRRKIAAMPLAHAEMVALSEAGNFLREWRFDGGELYVTLEPCPMCAGAIVAARLSRLVYGAADPRAGAAGTLYDIPRDPRMPHRCEVTRGVMAAESSALLRKFFMERRSKGVR